MSGYLLLIEDSPDDVVFFRRAIVKAGLSMVLQVANDGQQAIDFLARALELPTRLDHALPQVIVLDLKLPLVSGFEVLRWVRARPELKGVVVLVLTSSDHPADIRESCALGANSYLSKPSNPADLTALMGEVGTHWSRQNGAVPTAPLRSAAG